MTELPLNGQDARSARTLAGLLDVSVNELAALTLERFLPDNGGLRSRFATIFARSCQAWLTSQSIGSPSSRPPLGLQKINRRDLDKIWRRPGRALEKTDRTDCQARSAPFAC
jgi:hypothetical protein